MPHISTLFNNSGKAHATWTDFNAITSFGPHYVAGTTNGPGTGAIQFYTLILGLGSEYSKTDYNCQLAIPRKLDSDDTYLSIRYRESDAWSGWSKIKAGYADSAGTASTLSGFLNSNQNNPVVSPDDLVGNGIAFTQGVSLFGQSDGALFAQAFSTAWVGQIYQDYRTGQLALRGKSNGTWQPWRAVIDTVNVANYTVVPSGSYADPTWITSLSKSKVGLGNVENTALSTWAGSGSITTIGTLSSGTVPWGRLSDVPNTAVPTQSAVTYSATTDLSFNGASVQTVALTGNVTFTTSNKTAAKSIQIIISSDSSQRTLTFPSGWIWLGSAAPANIAASKTGMLSLYCKGSNESDVIAGWAVQS